MFDIFFSATPVIKLIMVGLAIASLWSWTIIIHKYMLFKKINYQTGKFEKKFWAGSSFDELYNQAKRQSSNPVVAVFLSAMHEWKKTASVNSDGAKQNFVRRLERTMHSTQCSELRHIENHLGFLSALGTNGVIIGLFGTVIGIMNSFQAIAHHQNTSLAIVAPGISEALFATALGLAAAIPAALAYNRFIINIDNIQNRMKSFTEDFLCLVERQLSEEE